MICVFSIFKVMDLYIDKDILLVGEANFSFSLSLSKYIKPQHITTTCYESRCELENCHGVELISSNLNELSRLGFKSVRFEIDATRLSELFGTEKFFSIYFMFPHVSGRSNLRKNRLLMQKFFASARCILEIDGAVIITLAAGQGGTSFEKEASKRCHRDSWTINQIAQQHRFIMTSCQFFQPSLFECYKSTGFRSQSKSFSIIDSLVHKFELSLPIDLNDDCEFSEFKSSLNDTHPFVQLRNVLVRWFSPYSNLMKYDG